MNISISIILDTRRIKKSINKYPVKLRVIIDRKSRNYQTKFDLSEEEFQRLSSSRIGESLQEVKTSLQELKRTLNNFIKEKEPDDFKSFENGFIRDNKNFRRRVFTQEEQSAPVDEFDYTPFLKRFKVFAEDHSRPGTISRVYLYCIKKLIQEGRIGSAINYQRSYVDLFKFRGNVLFKEITVPYLYQFEQMTLARGVSRSTVATILRPLRTVFNEAIEQGIIIREKCYPFGRRKYQIPATRNFKKALGIDDVKKIFYYEPVCDDQKRAKDFWLFCYLANGMNVKDMIYLKYKNIDGEFIVFERAKTERSTRRDSRLINVFIGDELKEIIARQGNNSKAPDNYLFPIIKPDLSILEQFDLLNHTRSYINEGMAAIRDALGIDKKITTIVSRHTFATVMKRSGASTEFIQESLGHTDPKTTENYLGSFENSVKKEFASALTAFKSSKTKSLKLNEL
jgi:integrase/recombinase XerD